MKCEIVRDLLPLYVENLCSPESREALEAHLADCPRCRELLKNLSNQTGAGTESRTESPEDAFLPEKDLLLRSKKAIRREFIQKLQRRIGLGIFSLGLLCNAAMILLVIGGYGLKYPRLSFKLLGSSQIWLLLMPFLPTLLGLTEFILARKKNESRPKNILLSVTTALLLPCVLAGAVYSALFLAFPPFASVTVTDDPARYLETDEIFQDVGAYSEVYGDTLRKFFPPRIPESASKIVYRFARYPALFSESFDIECSYVLPSDEYQASRSRALSFLRRFTEGETDIAAEPGAPKADAAAKTDVTDPDVAGPGTHTLSGTILPDLRLSFTYDDEDLKVSYGAQYTADR